MTQRLTKVEMFWSKRQTSVVTYVIKIILLTGLYFGTAKAGLSISPVSGFATLVWPPTGIALAVLFLFGKQYWPGVFLGALLTNLTQGALPLVALGIAVGNSLEAIVGSQLLHRYGFHSKLNHIWDVILLVGLVSLLATLVSATIGTTSLLFGGTIALSAYPATWIAWWVGDMLGSLIAAPFILVWANDRRKQFSLSKRIIEPLILIILFVCVCLYIFGGLHISRSFFFDSPYLVFPFLIWATIRFRTRLVVSLNLLLAAFTVLAAINSSGPFARGNLDETLFASQLFMGVTAVTFLAFSAIMSERRHAQQSLEMLLAERTAELRKEKEIEKLKDEFVAIASHELKTPITSLKAYAQILNKSLTRSKNMKAASLAFTINSQADKLTRLVEELLDVSRIESGKLVFYKTPFDMAELLTRVIDEFQQTIPTYKITTSILIKQQVVGDQNRIEQVLLNLLSNAVKYSPKAKKIKVKARSDKQQAIISVQDFGPGIPKKSLSKIFNRFYRVSDTSRKKQTVSGIGLGLFIASEIVKQHGGKMHVESKLGNGSTFSFTLPLTDQ